MKNSYWHYCLLAAILLVAALLRFFNLDFRPLWLDETYTALLSLGQGFDPVPRNQMFPLATVDTLFTLKPATCPSIAQLVATQDIHPPLFFCGLHRWLQAIARFHLPLTWSLRAFPALLGVVQVGGMYGLNRVAFSPTAGLMGAALMAVSPFHVYLSQEARHYTAPMLCVTLALVGLIHMGTQLRQQNLQPWVWWAWWFINVIGLYTHYFFWLAVVAQVATLLLWMIGHRSTLNPRHWITAGLTIAALLISYLPWLPILLEHMGRPETSWLSLSPATWLDYIPPIYQTLAGWIIMVVALPVERQPAWVALPMGLLMVTFFGWLMGAAYGGLRRLGRAPKTRFPTQLLLWFTGIVLLQFWVIIYGLGKDLSLAPRYNFVYYPAVCALLGAALGSNFHGQGWPKSWVQRWPLKRWLPMVVGGVSCLLVVFNLAFLTPYNPRDFVHEVFVHDISPSATPKVFLMADEGDTDIALGLSLIWEMHRREHLRPIPMHWAFFSHSASDNPSPERLERALPPIISLTMAPFELWLLGFRWPASHFPPRLQVMDQQQNRFLCQTEPEDFSGVTLPHQRYRCASPAQPQPA